MLLAMGGMLLVGCAPSQEAILPETGPTMAQLYRRHMQRVQYTALATARTRLASASNTSAHAQDTQPEQSPTRGSGHPTRTRPIQSADADLAGYTRSADHEIKALFPRLANPALVMYVFPHLAAGGIGVPGYATSFPMYTHVIYALPGEPAAASQTDSETP